MRAGTPWASSLVAGTPMPWEEYEARDEDVRAQYIDGRLLVTARPVREHQRAAFRLAVVLDGVLPEGWEVTPEWAWKPGADEFGPDLLVHPTTQESARFTGRPALVVEVLSGNRRNDLVRKWHLYAEAGLPHYWLLDVGEASLSAWRLGSGGRWEQVAAVTRASGPQVLDIEVAAVPVDVATLLG